MSHVEIKHTTCEGKCRDYYQVRLYGHHKDNYISVFRIERPVWSNKGELNSLNGKGFYDHIGPHVKEIYERCMVTELEFDVLASHLRLVQYKLRRYAVMNVVKTFVSAEGREFYVVKMTVKEQ